MNNACLLIPSYKPTESIVKLISDLRRHYSGPIVVVDDGNSSSEQQALFKNLIENHSVDVVHHITNLGKGRALKSGFNRILLNWPDIEWVITADSDGQHQISDILKLIHSTESEKNKDIFMGSRQFQGQVPLRSRVGNGISKYVFKYLVGLNIQDTQTGLRGYHRRILKVLLNTSGERFEFETNMLLEAKKNNWAIKEVPIATIYIDENKSSHFNPLYDSMKIYFLILRFLGSSITSSALDFLCFAVFINTGLKIYESNLLGRFISGWFNFYLNKNVVFKQKSNITVSMIRYWTLVFVMGTISSFIINGLVEIWDQPLILKLLAESVLFFISYAIQKEFVFIDTDRTKHE